DATLGLLIGGGVCFIFFVIGIFLTRGAILNRRKAEESTSWPSVLGKITKAWVETQKHEDDDGSVTITYFPRWEYEFAVSGMTYTSQTISFGGTGGSRNEFDVREGLSRFPINSQVEVFYNPSNPDEAILEPGTQGTMTLIVIGGILTVITFVIMVGLAINALTS
ncbi:MAG: DUF3592 domain-containing protein, partial [Anaerolineales bacterium]